MKFIIVALWVKFAHEIFVMNNIRVVKILRYQKFTKHRSEGFGSKLYIIVNLSSFVYENFTFRHASNRAFVNIGLTATT